MENKSCFKKKKKVPNFFAMKEEDLSIVKSFFFIWSFLSGNNDTYFNAFFATMAFTWGNNIQSDFNLIDNPLTHSIYLEFFIVLLNFFSLKWINLDKIFSINLASSFKIRKNFLGSLLIFICQWFHHARTVLLTFCRALISGLEVNDLIGKESNTTTIPRRGGKTATRKTHIPASSPVIWLRALEDFKWIKRA